MIRGGCLCGGVRFEIARAVGPFELCHCNRCRKASGSAFVPWLGALREDFRLLRAKSLFGGTKPPSATSLLLIAHPFAADAAPRYPIQSQKAPWFEVHAGVLDDDPGLRPERHILVEAKSPWFTISDALPQLDRAALTALRNRRVVATALERDASTSNFHYRILQGISAVCSESGT